MLHEVTKEPFTNVQQQEENKSVCSFADISVHRHLDLQDAEVRK